MAEQMASTHPDQSIAIWGELAADAIAGGNRRAYESALRHLRPMRDLLTRLGRQGEWETYLADVRAANRRRRALLETLDRLEEGPIIGA